MCKNVIFFGDPLEPFAPAPLPFSYAHHPLARAHTLHQLVDTWEACYMAVSKYGTQSRWFCLKGPLKVGSVKKAF